MHTQKKWVFLLQIFLLIVWLSLLATSDSYVSVYILCSVLALYRIIKHDIQPTEDSYTRKDRSLFLVISAGFSIAVLAANYPLLLLQRDPEIIAPFLNASLNTANILLGFAGGICVAYNILCLFFRRTPRHLPHKTQKNISPKNVFLFSFCCISFIDLIYLFLFEYPGHLSIDSIDQITQMYTGNYINSHPVWHTWAVQSILSVGYSLFSDINQAVALFSVCQLLFCAFCFSYAITTLYQRDVSNRYIVLCFLIYAVSPYNIALSITMWKDIPFSMAVFLLVVALYRILRSVSRHMTIEYCIFAVAAILICLMRTNGVLVILLSLICFIPILWKHHKKIILLLSIVLVICIFLCGPFLSLSNVQDTDFVEALSLPLQQLSRVVVDGHTLTEYETILLSKILDLDSIPVLYKGWLSDPIKNEVRNHDVTYLKEHMKEYLSLWFKLGVKYPKSYICAWIDQTKGYWNGGYQYYQYAEGIRTNDFGITKSGTVPILVSLKYEIFGFIKYHTIFEPLHSIGLHVWILLLCFLAWVRKKKAECLLCIPCISVILGLMIGTPVAYEFRYAYPVFLCVPFILLLTFASRDATDIR